MVQLRKVKMSQTIRLFLTFYKRILILIFLFLRIKVGSSQASVNVFFIFNDYRIFDKHGKYNRSLDGMWKSTPIEILLAEANLRNAKVMLDSRQRKFSARLATLPDENPAKNILPVTFRNGDGSAQPMEQPIGDTDQTRKGKRKGKQLDIRLARSIAIVVEIDLIESIKAIRQVALGTFPNTVIISPKKQALEKANTPRNSQVIWSDGFRLENGRTGSATVYQNTARIQIAKKSVLGDNKEVFDAEL